MPKGHKASTDSAKVAWLLANRELWHAYQADDDVRGQSENDRAIRKAVAFNLQDAGLVSARTGWADVNIGRLITKAREQLRTPIKAVPDNARATYDPLDLRAAMRRLQ